MVGQDEQHVLTRKVVVQQSRGREIAGNLLYPASLLGAVLLGMLAVAVSHYVRFHLMSGAVTPTDPDTEMLMVGGIGIAASFVMSQMFRLTSGLQRCLQGVGVFLMVCTFHNLPHWLPGPMAAAFSPSYVETMVAASPPNSFRFSGNYFPLFVATDVPADTATGAFPADEAAQPTAAPSAEPKKMPILRKGGKIVQGG